MPNIIRVFSLPTVIAMSSCTATSALDSRMDTVSDIFHSEGVVATLIVATADGENTHVYNNRRSKIRFSPASTFKIPNTLIALDAQAVALPGTPFTWDGTDKGMARWNKDQTLESAFRVSCVWCYQELARKIGPERYTTALASLDYGNQMIGHQIDAFWLNGSLEISAAEQIEFLKKLVHHEVPFRREHVDALKEIMLTEQTVDYSIYAKTGWAGTTPQVAWYVGFVTKSDETWLFAMNMRVDRPEQAALREVLTIRSLRALEILKALQSAVVSDKLAIEEPYSEDRQ